MTEIDYGELRTFTDVSAIEWIDDELCESLHSQRIRRLGQIPDDPSSLVHPDGVDDEDEDVEPIPEAKAKALCAVASQVKKIDYKDLHADKQIAAIDWISNRLSGMLNSQGIYRFGSIPTDRPELLVNPGDGNGSGIPEHDAQKLCSVAREFELRYESNEEKTTATQTRYVDMEEAVDGYKRGLEVALMASDKWHKNRDKNGDPDPRGWDISRDELENPEEWDNPRSLTSSAIEALSVVSARHGETINRLAWVDMDSDNPHASEHAFEDAHEQLDETFPHMVIQTAITPPWNDLPNLPKHKYPEPDDHPEVGSYRNKKGEKEYYWKKAPQAAKKQLMSDVDVVIHMDNYDYIRQEIMWADKAGCEMYIHEIEKHRTDELTDIPDHVGTPSKVPSEYVESSYNRAKDRKAKGTESIVDHSKVDDAVTSDTDVGDPKRAVAPEMEGAASEHIIRGPSDTDEGRENPYLDQSATMEQQNRRDTDRGDETFDGHKRKEKQRKLSGNTEVQRDGTDVEDDDEELNSDTAEMHHQ